MSSSISEPLNKSLKESIQANASLTNKLSAQKQNQEVMTQSMLAVDEDEASKLIKRYKIATYASICCCVTGLIFFLIIPPVLHGQIVSGAIEQAILTKDNEGLWAHFPGDTNTIITRNFSFFDLINDEQVLLQGAKPKFRQIQGYIITQKQDYLDIQYKDDGNIVAMRDWLHFDVHEDSRSLQQKVKIINVPSLGFWYSLKNSKQSQVFIQGFSLLFTNIENSIIQTVIGQGIYSQFLSDRETTITNLLMSAGISRQNSIFVYQDPNFGVGTQDNIGYWVQATQTSFSGSNLGFSNDAINLKDYFTLTDQQIFFVLTKFKNYITSIQKLIIKNHYCEGIANCNGRELAIRQIAESYVTRVVPPVGDVAPSDTICEANVTCAGYFPQLYAYYHNIYLKEHPEESPMLQFDVEMVRKWLDYNPKNIPKYYNKAEYALFHLGNLDALFGNGTLYDQTKDQTVRQKYLLNIRTRFGLETNAHTRVFWGWIKYIMSDLLRQSTKGNQILGISSTFVNQLYPAFSSIQDNLQIFLIKQLMKRQLEGVNCLTLLTLSFESNNVVLINKICDKFNYDVSDDNFIMKGILACRNKYQKEWTAFIDMGVSQLMMESFCDESVLEGFGELYDEVRVQLNDFYECDKTPNRYCSDYQLALKQWANSTITQTIPQQLKTKLKPTKTFSDWHPSSPKIEYSYYSSKFPNKQLHNFTMDQIFHKFNFDNFFGATQILSLFRSNATNVDFKNYIRYVVIYIGFGGFTRERTVREFIFGYNDENLLEIKEMYPPFGGDPSVPAYVAFNDLNLTAEQAVLTQECLTGKNDSKMLGQYQKINGLRYLTNNFTYFNGNQTYWKLESPWQGEDYFYGTSGKQFAPDQQNSKNISIYVPNLQRYGSGSSVESYPYERYGYDLRIAYLGEYIFQNKYQYPENAKYYQNFFAVFNETSVLGFPLFITKHHFMNCSQNWTDILEMYNQNMTIKYENTSHWDDSFVIVEPYSGLAFQAVIYLQSNYYYEPDQLFTYNQTTMMPVFSIFRSGNVTQQQANQLFGLLVTGLTLKSVFFYLGLVLSIVCLILAVFSWLKMTKYKKCLSHKNKDLNLSMQRQKQSSKKEQNEDKDNYKPLIVQKFDDDEIEQKKEQNKQQQEAYKSSFQIKEEKQLRQSVPISDSISDS